MSSALAAARFHLAEARAIARRLLRGRVDSRPKTHVIALCMCMKDVVDPANDNARDEDDIPTVRIVRFADPANDNARDNAEARAAEK